MKIAFLLLGMCGLWGQDKLKDLPCLPKSLAEYMHTHPGVPVMCWGEPTKFGPMQSLEDVNAPKPEPVGLWGQTLGQEPPNIPCFQGDTFVIYGQTWECETYGAILPDGWHRWRLRTTVASTTAAVVGGGKPDPELTLKCKVDPSDHGQFICKIAKGGD